MIKNISFYFITEKLGKIKIWQNLVLVSLTIQKHFEKWHYFVKLSRHVLYDPVLIPGICPRKKCIYTLEKIYDRDKIYKNIHSSLIHKVR